MASSRQLQIILALALTLTARAQCPLPFRSEAGRCMFVNSSQTFNWCSANRQCASIGGELVNSYDSLKLLAGMPSVNCGCKLWFGITDLADERNRSRSGWQLVNGNGELPLNNSMWFTGMPNNNGNQDCISMSNTVSNSFIDSLCSALRGIACEYSASEFSGPAPGTATWLRTEFQRTSYNPSSEYCHTDLPQVKNAIHCVAAAARLGSRRQALYNSRLSTCRLLQFVDAQVEEEIENSADWVKLSLN